VVIVQSHLLRDKGSVRLRYVSGDGTIDASSSSSSGGGSSNERFVEVENLALTIRELSSEFLNDGGGDEYNRSDDPHRHLMPMDSSSLAHHHLHHINHQYHPSSTKESNRNSYLKPSVDCIYVDHDQFYDGDRPVSKSETPNWKVVLKTMKAISQKGEQFVTGLADPSTVVDAGESLPIFAVADISFWALRDFGTCLMKRGQQEKSAIGACRQITEEYPKFKRVLKTLGSAIESFMKRNGYWSSSSSSSSSTAHREGHHREGHHRKAVLVSILLYSRADDRFDMISLESEAKQENSNDTGRSSRRKYNT
jgi:hypothetical protein